MVIIKYYMQLIYIAILIAICLSFLVIVTYGYSYWSGNGKLYNCQVKNYGDPYGQNDIIDIWVDLRDDKRELFFAKNDKKYGVIQLHDCESGEYKLAVAMYGEEKKIELLSIL